MTPAQALADAYRTGDLTTISEAEVAYQDDRLAVYGAVTLRLYTAAARFAAQALLSAYADTLAAMPGETPQGRIVSLHLAAVGVLVALPTLTMIAALVIVALERL